MAESEENPLVSTTRASESSPAVQLHPLVLLTISDYLTRHTLRKHNWPVIGAIIGLQNGREVTMEVAFECKVLEKDEQWIVDDTWFQTRLEQYKDVYKSPALDLVGWFSIGQVSGPQTHHIPIQEYFQGHNESSIFLLFQPESVSDMANGKLPLALYESVTEGATAGDSSTMEVDGANAHANKLLKFRELNYTVETGEAEMISVDSVARGGGNATAVDGTKPQTEAQPKDTTETSPTQAAPSKGKGKAKDATASTSAATPTADSLTLTTEDEELLSSITAKTNAIRMLHKRVNLLQKYLDSLPASYLTDATLPIAPVDPDQRSHHIILRSIAALLARFPILAPPDTEAFQQEAAEVKSDVALVGLLSNILSSAHAAKEMGRKFAVVEGAKQAANARKGGGHGGASSQYLDTVLSEGGGGSAGDLFSGGPRRKLPFGVGDGGYA